MWGIRSPTKAILPARATDIPVSSATQPMVASLTQKVRWPSPAAMSSPSEMMVMERARISPTANPIKPRGSASLTRSGFIW
ncbi:hypothetical protein D3C81_1852140 [compost metagenome]